MRSFAVISFVAGMMLTFMAVAPAQAQATRTWVSGVGDDANPCSRTAPCKTFAGAISKTAAAGEINCLDPGGFGAVTITKSMMISCEAGTAGVLTSAGNGVNVNALATDTVILRGLVFDGLGTASSGVRVTSAQAVQVVNCVIRGFNLGIEFVPTSNAKLFSSDVILSENSTGGIRRNGRLRLRLNAGLFVARVLEPRPPYSAGRAGIELLHHA